MDSHPGKIKLLVVIVQRAFRKARGCVRRLDPRGGLKKSGVPVIVDAKPRLPFPRFNASVPFSNVDTPGNGNEPRESGLAK